MKERPILMSAPMVNALLAGRKTQTRRILRYQPSEPPEVFKMSLNKSGTKPVIAAWWDGGCCICPYGQPGDRLWVREAHYLTDNGDSEYAVYAADGDAVRKHLAEIDELPRDFPESVKKSHRKLRSSIHMPRWASRILLEITDIRVERLQDISEEDAVAEGAFSWASEQTTPVRDIDSARLAYIQLWESINGPGSWDLNPYVWVISFRRVNHDQ
jgi:hypothetical protein